MRLTSKAFKQNLHHEIFSPKHLARYRQAHFLRSALRSCPTVDSLLSTLSSPAARTLRRKECITRALIVEHQEAPSSFWSSILLASYLPMLIRLTKRYQTHLFFAEDLDQLAVTCFCEVILSLSVSKKSRNIGRTLRHKTQRRFVEALKKEARIQRYAQNARFEELPISYQPLDTFEAFPAVLLCELKKANKGEFANILRKYDAVDMPVKKLIWLTTSLVRQDRKIIGRNCQPQETTPQDRKIIYQRLKKRRHRALKTLREVVLNNISDENKFP